MALWLVRGGSEGEREHFDQEKGVSAIGFKDISDLRRFRTKEEITREIREKRPQKSPGAHSVWARELWSFSNEIKLGDLIAMPMKGRAVISLGKVIGAYEYRVDFPEISRHTLKIDWIGEFPRTSFDQDILRSLGVLVAIAKVRVENVDARIQGVINGNTVSIPSVEPGDENVESETKFNIERFTRDQISEYINRKFKGHDLERLTGAVLEAQGYLVRISPEGPDGGIDILAGSGPLGFDPPRLAVQVKSGNNPVDIDVLRAFSGVMARYKAEHGLIVAWNGFKGTVEKEAAQDYFKIRLWDADDLVENIQQFYDKLPDEIQAELPLKRIWIMVPEEE